MPRRAWSLAALSAVATVIACSADHPPSTSTLPECLGPAFEGAPLGVRCGALVDAQGRTVLLHGVNARVEGVFDVTFDDGRAPVEEVPPFTREDAERMRAVGYDSLRLPINWSGVEPTENGGFDDLYAMSVPDAVDHVADFFGIAPLSTVTRDALIAAHQAERASVQWDSWWAPTNLLTMAMLAPEMHMA